MELIFRLVLQVSSQDKALKALRRIEKRMGTELTVRSIHPHTEANGTFECMVGCSLSAGTMEEAVVEALFAASHLGRAMDRGSTSGIRTHLLLPWGGRSRGQSPFPGLTFAYFEIPPAPKPNSTTFVALGAARSPANPLPYYLHRHPIAAAHAPNRQPQRGSPAHQPLPSTAAPPRRSSTMRRLRVLEDGQQEYVWDPRGRLAAVVDPATGALLEAYAHDTGGRLAAVLRPGGQRETFVHEGHQMVAAFDETGAMVWGGSMGAGCRPAAGVDRPRGRTGPHGGAGGRAPQRGRAVERAGSGAGGASGV